MDLNLYLIQILFDMTCQKGGKFVKNKVTIQPANTVPVTRLKVKRKNDFKNRKLKVIPRL